MELYYQNETLYIDIEMLLDSSDYYELKNKLFRIVEDYEIDYIIINNNTHQVTNRRFLKRIKQEYATKFRGHLYIN